jgi:hypothetical protein
MSEAEEPKPTAPADDARNAPQPKDRSKMLRGCGCLGGLCLLGLGILITGDFDSTAWASALIAIVIGSLVFSLSGTNGMWDDK